MRFRLLVLVLLAAIAARFANTATAQTPPLSKLYINTGPDPLNVYGYLRYGGRDWRGITALLDQSFDITKGAALPSLSQLVQFDALWVDQHYAVAPSATDISTILGFAATGRRVVLVGENSSTLDLKFLQWSAPLVQALGGSQPPVPNAWDGPGCLYGPVSTVLNNQLTAGVQTIGLGCAGFAIGGTPLFSYNVATLWGPLQNVITVLDANAFDDFFPVGTDGPQFHANLVTWLQGSATVVPEPTTFALLVPSLAGLFALARRRRHTRRSSIDAARTLHQGRA